MVKLTQKCLIFCLMALMFFSNVIAQENAAPQDVDRPFVGSWEGSLSAGGQSLPLIVHILISESGYQATMDSPLQQAMGLPFAETLVEGDSIALKMPAMGIVYTGRLSKEGNIVGKFNQAGMSFDLIFVREGSSKEGQIAVEHVPIKRPQEPELPFPYESVDVVFHNEQSGHKLAGTLTLPQGDGPFAAVILVSGSGPQDRNSEIFDHKPFLVHADHLTRHGIAVLRYDERGVGQSEGNHNQATSMDLAEDVQAAYRFLVDHEKISQQQIGIIGHSEGGMIAPIVAAAEPDIAFIVLMAAPGIPIDELMLLQTKMVLHAQGANEEAQAQAMQLNSKIYGILKDNSLNEAEARNAISSIASGLENSVTPWFRYFINFNPQDYLSKVKCPVLAINGGKDIQVSAQENLAGIVSTMQTAGNDQVTTHVFDDMNHLFQTAESGNLDEYARLEETISPKVMMTISDWIKWTIFSVR